MITNTFYFYFNIMYITECKDASCTSLGPCLLADSKEVPSTTEEQCTNNLGL